jgi:hypothetical protein
MLKEDKNAMVNLMLTKLMKIYQFSPLKHAPNVLEVDEVIPATAVVLCIYVLLHDPKL